jgi:hypothetical protein
MYTPSSVARRRRSLSTHKYEVLPEAVSPRTAMTLRLPTRVRGGTGCSHAPQNTSSGSAG